MPLTRRQRRLSRLSGKKKHKKSIVGGMPTAWHHKNGYFSPKLDHQNLNFFTPVCGSANRKNYDSEPFSQREKTPLPKNVQYGIFENQIEAGSTQGCSRTVPQFSTDRALRRLTSEFGRDPVYSARYGRQRTLWASYLAQDLHPHWESQKMKRKSPPDTLRHRGGYFPYTHTRKNKS